LFVFFGKIIFDFFKTIYKSLKNLLTFNEQKENMTIEDAFGLTFQVAIADAMGSKLTFDLLEFGETISVTNDNREVIK